MTIELPKASDEAQERVAVSSTRLLGGGKWTQTEAIELCVKIEAICPAFGCHVALTGGLLYKTGERKDCDLLFYRIRQVSEINLDGLWAALLEIGLNKSSGFGWCYKCEYQGKPIDCFMPEEQGGEYNADGEPPNDPSSATCAGRKGEA